MAVSVQHKLNLEKDTLKKVTVFNDRAELKREFVVDVKEGPNEVIFMNVTKRLFEDSVRVNGKGDAVIEEVKVADLTLKAEEQPDKSKESELNERKKSLTRKQRAAEYEKGNIVKKAQVIDALLAKVGHRDIGASKDSLYISYKEELESISDFFVFYDENIAKLREQTFAKEKELEDIQNELNDIQRELAPYSSFGVGDQHQKSKNVTKTITVFLDCRSEGKVTLELVYQVPGVSWTPLYDLRVETKDDKTELQVSYYANVTQRSGEDWEGGELILSTARPSQGGAIPELATVDVRLKRPPPAPQQQHSFGFGNTAYVQPARTSLFGASPSSAAPPVMFGTGAAAPRSPSPPPMQRQEAKVEQNTVSTQFVISRPASIPSDGAQHKVTIGVVTLSAQFVHEAVPSKNCSAFLTASCLNTSALSFLPGQASIFLDGAYVAKTSLQAVSPGERFRCSLGVDPSVKIEYKPVHTFHEQSGYINKSSSTVHEKKIVVKNTRADSIILTVREAIPRSTDEKIKVKLISPDQAENIGEIAAEAMKDNPAVLGAKIMPNNNLEWTINLGKGASQTLVVKYTVEHPIAEKVEFVDRKEFSF